MAIKDYDAIIALVCLSASLCVCVCVCVDELLAMAQLLVDR